MDVDESTEAERAARLIAAEERAMALFAEVERRGMAGQKVVELVVLVAEVGGWSAVPIATPTARSLRTLARTRCRGLRR
jgi:hypothetical protein